MRRVVLVFLAATMRWPSLFSWLRQPTTIMGLSGLVGVLVGLLDGSVTWLAALPVAVGALVMVAIPEHSNAPASASRLTADALLLLNPARRIEAVGRLGRDLVEMTGTGPPPVAAVAVATVDLAVTTKPVQ